ncbi:MAG: endonuclease/exonuclease/phosphatase family protein [Akkermansiaceae bacterium]|jgi:endonuclease/exonuclease/phosphatase family metal-dependent hydrolase|nr:endonuclease/exonuclease/phosphatase family protein [Akkermansiaceae bacterium]MDC0324925.1 endonuclease/exonuclease/phosphatase family protein [Akkermansiaceae bacterium]|tara:strand:+ start:2052 stop:2864 length:813 start_codon:yes stop_codon:yes gene_type:complete
MKIFFLFLFMFLPVTGEVKVVTYNVRQDTNGDRGERDWKRRSPRVVEFLKKGSFSIIGLQEAKHNQVEDVKRGLPKFVQIGVGRDDGKKRGEYSPIFFDPEIWKADLAEQGTFWLSDTPKKPGSMTWGNRVTRICSWVRLIGKEGESLYAYNTHWDHQSQPSREKAAELILKRVSERKHSGDPVILMGDFNATTTNPAIKTLIKSGALVDHGGEKQKQTFNFWKPGLNEGLRIDHIFTSPLIKKAKIEVPAASDPVDSDHNPVILTFDGL